MNYWFQWIFSNKIYICNKLCATTPTLIGLNPIELNYDPFITSLDIYKGSSHIVDDLGPKLCVPNKWKYINAIESNMITRINEGKTSMKHILCDCKCKFEDKKCNSNQKWENNNC